MMTSTAAAAEFSDMPDDWSTAVLKNAVANGLIIGDDGRILPGVILKDLTVNGDLIIGDSAGSGEVVLDGVAVAGRTVMARVIKQKDGKITRVL